MAADSEPARLRRGDPNAFDALLNRYQNRLFRYLVRFTGNTAHAEDLFQQTWLKVMTGIPNALGFIAYFILRDPLLQPCAACGATARRDFAFCPQCGSPLPRVCPSCRRPVEPIWPHCAHCGQKLHAQTDASTPATEG